MSLIHDGGPYLAAAVLCEKVLKENDGVLSAIRMVDRIVTTAAGGNAPERMPPVQISLALLLAFKSGTAQGNYQAHVTPNLPSGRALPGMSFPMLLEGEDRGANIVANLAFAATEEGLYWFDILINEELVTRVPLRIVYQRIGVGSAGTSIH